MIDFEKGEGLVPAIVQDARSSEVLMLAYLSEESWAKTLAERTVCFYSRSKQALWTKGETSGNFLHLKSYQIDCDRDTVLLLVEPEGPVCHTGTDTCFGNRGAKHFIHRLEAILEERLAEESEESYTVSLAQKGLAKVAQKVGEEAVETVIEALGDNDEAMIDESADLLYHLCLLLKLKGLNFEQIEARLAERHSAARS